jgi:Na+/proline symporter
MSTISTHLNWGSSYIVDDFYRRFVAADRDERHYVRMARVSTVLLVVFTSIVAFWLENALQAFQILLQIGAGTGLIFLLRWYWWRINAWSEISAMVISFSVAVYFQFIHETLGFATLHPSLRLVLGVAITTVGWLALTFLTPPTDRSTLESFFAKIRPLGPGWRKVVGEGPHSLAAAGPAGSGESLSAAFGGWFLACLVVYSALFATGYALYGNLPLAAACFTVSLISAVGLYKLLPKVGFAD